MSTATGAEKENLLDAEMLLASVSVEELAARADELVRSMQDPSALLAKPCGSLREAPDLLTCFGLLLGGIAPLPGMTVLDFGAGSCWTSHFLSQMGCRVIAMDISPAMLELGRRRYDEHPVFGVQPRPQFSVFDGHRMELEDATVDRVLCFDALHHVGNMREVLLEIGRVLAPGGLAGFSEPGPNHSKDAQSQHEMRRYGVPERDLVLEDVWKWAREAGFVDLSVALFSPSPQWVTLGTFNGFLVTSPSRFATRLGNRGVQAFHPRGRPLLDRALLPMQRLSRLVAELSSPQTARAAMAYVANVRAQLSNRRMFLMRKEGEELPDSREASGLRADLLVERLNVETGPSTSRVTAVCTITNTGRNRWLPSSAGIGAVLLGLRTRHGRRPSSDHGRVSLPGDRMFPPGERVIVELETEIETPGIANDPVWLEVDLVSEGISWFAEVHGHPVEIAIPPYANS